MAPGEAAGDGATHTAAAGAGSKKNDDDDGRPPTAADRKRAGRRVSVIAEQMGLIPSPRGEAEKDDGRRMSAGKLKRFDSFSGRPVTPLDIEAVGDMVTEHNMVEYLGLIEQRLIAIVLAYQVRFSKGRKRDQVIRIGERVLPLNKAAARAIQEKARHSREMEKLKHRRSVMEAKAEARRSSTIHAAEAAAAAAAGEGSSVMGDGDDGDESSEEDESDDDQKGNDDEGSGGGGGGGAQATSSIKLKPSFGTFLTDVLSQAAEKGNKSQGRGKKGGHPPHHHHGSAHRRNKRGSTASKSAASYIEDLPALGGPRRGEIRPTERPFSPPTIADLEIANDGGSHKKGHRQHPPLPDAVGHQDSANGGHNKRHGSFLGDHLNRSSPDNR